MDWTFFEHLNDLVIVTDLESHELVYMNERARREYEVSDNQEIVGKPCYEVLQGASCVCADCGVETMKEGQFYERPSFNPVLRGNYLMRDTLVRENGRLYRVEFCEDGNTVMRRNEIHSRHQNMELLANEGFRAALNAESPDEAIMVILEFLGKVLHGERSYIFEHNEKGNDDNTYEWCAEGVQPCIDMLQDLPAEVCENWYNLYKSNQIVLYPDIEEFRESDPLQYENLKRQGIRSIVTVPLMINNRAIGFYGVDNPPAEDLQATSNMLQITAHFIVSQLRQRNLIRQLQQMSHHDRLTGLGNRYALDEYMIALNPEESVAAVFCDITGLKHVNDTLGHVAGDRMILRARDCIMTAFSPENVFRTGGDELVIICPRLKEQELAERIETMRQAMPRYEVNIAVGAVWRERCDGHIEALMDEAEKIMYDDKALWYETNMIERRR